MFRKIVLLVLLIAAKNVVAFGSELVLPDSIVEGYVRLGERHLHRAWAELPDSVFAQFKKNGNRVNYEGLCFDRRRQLAELVMAEVVEDKGRFMGDILDGIRVHIAEPWWGIPAHYSKAKPDHNVQTVDLFNAETASMIAWTRHLLASKLENLAPGLCDTIDSEIEHRFLIPAARDKYWWKGAGMNWNPWICSNWLACISFCEKNESRRADALSQIENSLQRFIDAYPDDGGCDEGPGYWDRAAASLFECMQWHDFKNIDRQKLQRMGAYIYKVYIGNDYCVDFADSHTNRSVQQLNILYPFALYVNDITMRQFAAHMFCRDLSAYYGKSGNFPTLGREVMFLRHLNELMAEQPHEPLLEEVWLPDLQIMTAREHEGTVKGLYVAMKGGHNDESHNHNDVGSFIVYADGEPLIIDAGVGEYTSKTFSGGRYDIWTMQSAYHNLPRINGVGQKDGKQYRATEVSHTPKSLSMDIANAYPAEAKVGKWLRTVTLSNKGKVCVTEDYVLKEYLSPSQIIFITPVKPQLKRGKVVLGKHAITFDRKALVADVEDISNLEDSIIRGMWGTLYRITLTLNSNTTTGKIRYIID